MARMKDPRGILTFIFRYLVLHVVFLLGLLLSARADLALYYFFGFMGFFTFIQVLASISRKFLDHGGVLKLVAVLCAIATDVPILWYFGWMLRGLSPNHSDWDLVANWLPFHFIAAVFAWGLREIIHAVSSGGTAEPRNPSGPIIQSRPIDPRASADPGASASPSGSEGADAPTGDPASKDANTDDR
ncbi:hypothetical protein QU668_07490 [Schaalia sp. HMT-877]|nr:hypothetical protein HMPREF1550_00523 [Actinomyces sp. oral taxon 877 str. F0543]WLD79383.1 hypothetical protein QU668_07490 [Schaalia sp. HMT-877]